MIVMVLIGTWYHICRKVAIRTIFISIRENVKEPLRLEEINRKFTKLKQKIAAGNLEAFVKKWGIVLKYDVFGKRGVGGKNILARTHEHGSSSSHHQVPWQL